MSLPSATRKQLIEQHRVHEKDTGSPEVQISLLSQHIKELTQHLQTHPKDYSSRRGLLTKVNRRNKLLRYLERNEHARYLAILQKLELRR